MTKVIVTAKVKDVGAWEKGFRTHADLFKSSGQTASPILFGIGSNDEVAVCFEVANLQEYQKFIETAENVAAMEADGVRRDTVRNFVLDKEFEF